MSNYNINDVLSVGNPLDDGKGFECIKCNQAGEMTYQALPSKHFKNGFDYSCGHCGEWQLEGGEMKTNIKDNFSDDAEKMADFEILTKKEFLTSYSYLTEEEYDNTKREVENDTAQRNDN